VPDLFLTVNVVKPMADTELLELNPNILLDHKDRRRHRVHLAQAHHRAQAPQAAQADQPPQEALARPTETETASAALRTSARPDQLDPPDLLDWTVFQEFQD